MHRNTGEMTKDEKDRRTKRSMKHYANRTSVGLDELRGNYFAHGGHGSGNKVNKTNGKLIGRIGRHKATKLIGRIGRRKATKTRDSDLEQ